MKKFCFSLMLALLILHMGCSQESVVQEKQQMSTETSQDIDEINTQEITLVDFAGREITLPTVPQQIVALGHGEVDIIYALGGEVVGRPSTRTPYPVKEAEHVEQVGSAHEVDLEKITFLQADVVLGNNPLNLKDVQVIESIGAKMILTSANSIDEIKEQIKLFGLLLQKEEKANQLVQQIEEKLATVSVQEEHGPRVLLVYGAPGTYMAALPNSLSGNILELAGGVNIASDYPSLENFPQYAQLNTERIMEANPQLILLMSHGNPEEVREGFIKEMEENAAWNSLDAVVNQRVEILPADLFGTNPGTRVTEAVEYMAELVQTVQ